MGDLALTLDSGLDQPRGYGITDRDETLFEKLEDQNEKDGPSEKKPSPERTYDMLKCYIITTHPPFVLKFIGRK